jgi:hypothetical protein
VREPPGFELSELEVRRLYPLLRERGLVDPVVARLRERIEEHLYRVLTIEELEELQRDHGRDDQ